MAEVHTGRLMTFDEEEYRDSDSATAAVVLDEARETLARQDARIEQVETKSSWVLAASGVLLTALVTVLPVWLDRGDPSGVALVIGSLAIVGLLGAASTALLAIQGKRYPATDYDWLMELTARETFERKAPVVQATLAADSFDKARHTSIHAGDKAQRYRQSLWFIAVTLASLGVLAFGSIIDQIRT